MEQKGKLYLIPTTLGDNNPLEVLPLPVKEIVDKLNYFIVENEKSARRFIKKISPNKLQSSLIIKLIDKYADVIEVKDYLDVCNEGISAGLLSEAGVPGIADPGSEIVKIAHQKNIKVVPLVGPSSILLSMMASGMNGQNFTFNGYLPIDTAKRKKEIKKLERLSFENNQSQIFIETPYRNDKMFEELLKTLNPLTRLCVASNVTLNREFIKTDIVKNWLHKKPALHKKPTIFIIHKD